MAGWCIGSTIAFEVSRQLEQMKKEIKFLALFNSIPPNPGIANITNKFTFESERKWVLEYLPDQKIKQKLKEISKIQNIWPLIVDYLEKIPFDVRILKEALSANIGDVQL